jgi:tetratricopeptide (TPR) repeat protein
MSEVIHDKNLYRVFQLIREKKYDDAKALLDEQVAAAVQSSDKNAEGLYESAYGFWWKIKGDFKESLKHYQRAEKCIPSDAALKVIVAVLLMDEFAQYENALMKVRKALKQDGIDLALWHHAKSEETLCLLKLGKKKEANQSFEELVYSDFSKLRTATNLSFRALSEFVQKDINRELSEKFISQAKALCSQTKETVYTEALNRIEKLAGWTQ